MPDVVNIAERLKESVLRRPDQPAVVQPLRKRGGGSYRYETWSFRELDDVSDRVGAGLVEMGVRPGMRLVLFVPFSREFLALTFGLFKAGAVIVLIDPGMGRANIFRCLEEVAPDGFVAVGLVHLVRLLHRRRFRAARYHVTVGRRWFWGGKTYGQLLRTRGPFAMRRTRAIDPAAVIYTSGSTGPPKGVLYEHGMFDAQVEMIRDFYGIEPGEIDLPGFPLFGLFNAAMGVTTVIPDMDPTRPAKVDPRNIVQHVRDWGVTQAFGSPAFWDRVARYCESTGTTFPTLRRALSAGGPVPNHVLERMSRALTADGAELHTPYGATECLPVASIGSRTVLAETAALTRKGAGTCVGAPFPGVAMRIVEMTDGPIESIDDAVELGPGEIGEIIVHSRSMTRSYERRPDATRLAKIDDATAPASDDGRPALWHRMGDVGYLDAQGRFWFCGRKAHVVETESDRMLSVPCEAIFNEHPRVYRSALVGIGPRPRQIPVMVIEPESGQMPTSPAAAEAFRRELLALGAESMPTRSIEHVLFHPSLPVDSRHNVKIDREALAVWAARQRPDLAETAGTAARTGAAGHGAQNPQRERTFNRRG